jgi:hypothetical protein
MTLRAMHLLLLIAACAAPSPARAAQVCRARPSSGPVSILILDSAAKVAEFAAATREADVAVRERGTVIFADGRVVTADVDAATRHLNALGWGARPIEIVASFRIRPNPPPGGG